MDLTKPCSWTFQSPELYEIQSSVTQKNFGLWCVAQQKQNIITELKNFVSNDITCITSHRKI